MYRELVRIYGALEEETLDVTESGNFRDADVALLVSEFGVLNSSLANVCTSIESGMWNVVSTEEMEELNREIPDLRNRIGLSVMGNNEQTIEVFVERMSRCEDHYDLKRIFERIRSFSICNSNC